MRLRPLLTTHPNFRGSLLVTPMSLIAQPLAIAQPISVEVKRKSRRAVQQEHRYITGAFAVQMHLMPSQLHDFSVWLRLGAESQGGSDEKRNPHPHQFEHISYPAPKREIENARSTGPISPRNNSPTYSSMSGAGQNVTPVLELTEGAKSLVQLRHRTLASFSGSSVEPCAASGRNSAGTNAFSRCVKSLGISGPSATSTSPATWRHT